MKKNSRPLKQDRMRREDRSAESKTPKQLQGRRHRQDMIAAMTCLDDPKDKTAALPPAAQPRPTASSPLFSQIASRWFDILPWQPEEANLDLARAIPPPPRARHCTCPPARPSAILEEPPGFRRQDL